MADFNAGSIEGTLDLDTDPFTRGLRLARFQAQQFENTDYTATLRTKYTSDGKAPEIPDADTESTVETKVGADDSAFQRTMAKVHGDLDRFKKRKTESKVDLDANTFSRGVATISRQLDALIGKKPQSDGSGGRGMLALIGLAAALAPALGPAVPAVALFGAAAAAAFGGAAIGLGLWAASAKSAFAVLQKANEEGVMLAGAAGKAQEALAGLKKAWGDLQKQVQPGIFKVMTDVFDMLQGVLPKLVPLINSVSKGLRGMIEPIKHVLDGGQFERFIQLLSENAVKDLPMLGQILANIFKGLMSLFTALNPVIQVGLKAFVGITNEFQKWARFKAPAFIEEVFGTVRKYGPAMMSMLGNIIVAVASIAAGFAPLVGPATTFLNGLADALDKIDLAPLAKGVGDVLVALTPFLDVIAELVNVLLPPLGSLLSTLAGSLLDPLAESLTSILVPAFETLAEILDFINPYLADVISNFATLVNPDGVSLLATLLEALQPVVEALVPPLSDLAIAILNLMTDSVMAMLPVLLVFADLLVKAAEKITPLVDGLSGLLKMDGVAEIVGGIALALGALWAVFQVGSGIAALVNPLTLIIAAVVALGVGLVYAYNHSAKFREVVGQVSDWVMTRLWPALKQLGDFLVNTLAPAWWDLAKTVGKNLLPIFEALADVFVNDVLPVLSDVFDKLVEWWPAISKVLGIVVKFAAEWVKFASKMWGTVLPVIIEIAGWLFGKWATGLGALIVLFVDTAIQIVQFAQDVWDAGQSIWDFFVSLQEFITGLPDKIAGWFSGAAEWLVDKGEAIIKGLYQGVREKWADVRGWLKDRQATVKAFFNSARNWLVDKGVSIIAGLYNGVKNKWNDIKAWFKDRARVVKDFFANAVDWLFDKGKAILRGLHNGITEKWEDTKTWLTDISVKIVTAVGDLSETLKQKGKDLMNGFWNGLKEIWEQVKDWLGGLKIDLPGPGLPGKIAADSGVKGGSGPITRVPRLSTTPGGALAAQRALSDSLAVGLDLLVERLVEALLSLGGDLSTSEAETRRILVEALGEHADRVVKSDKDALTTLITRLRQG